MTADGARVWARRRSGSRGPTHGLTGLGRSIRSLSPSWTPSPSDAKSRPPTINRLPTARRAVHLGEASCVYTSPPALNCTTLRLCRSGARSWRRSNASVGEDTKIEELNACIPRSSGYVRSVMGSSCLSRYSRPDPSVLMRVPSGSACIDDSLVLFGHLLGCKLPGKVLLHQLSGSLTHQRVLVLRQ